MIVLVGLNHKTAPVQIRERLAFAEADLSPSLRRLVQQVGIEEALILSTCNRVEILARGPDAAVAIESVKAFLAGAKSLSPGDLNGHLYVSRNRDAVRHLFQVASGLDSMILGEPQILGQVKRAYITARDAGAVGPVLERLMQQTLSTAKRVRTDTGISRHAVSLAFAAVELARKIFGELAGRPALIVGAGKMNGLVAQHLAAHDARVRITSRRFERAAVFAERRGGEAVRWDDAWNELDRVDVVVAGTAAPHTILDPPTVQRAMRARRNRPLFIIDLAVPRDVDPAVNQTQNVYLYDIDDLQDIVKHNLSERKRAAAEGRAMIELQVREFARWRRAQDVTPTLVALRENLLDVGRKEVDRFRKRLGSLSEQQEQTVEQLTRAIIQKILHRPTRYLKELAQRDNGHVYAELYREIFGIEGTRDATPGPSRGATARDTRQVSEPSRRDGEE